MKDIFSVSDSEKDRIRKLHLIESSAKKIDSTLNEQEQSMGVRVNEPVMGDDMEKTDISIVDKEMVPSDDEGLQQSQMPAHYHVFRWCKQGGEVVYYLQPNQMGIQGTQLQNASQQFYNLMGSPSVGEIIHITLNPSLPQRRMCYEYLGQLIRTTALDNSATAFPSGGNGPIRDTGSYTTCQDCEQTSTGGPDGYCVDCVNGQMTYYPGPSGQQWTSCPQGYVDIGPTPNPPGGGPCIECQGGNCSQAGWGYGQNHYNSISDCQQQCQSNYECINNSCVPDPNGQYTSMAQCQQNCGNFGAGWFCLPPGGQGSCQYTPSMTIGPNGPFLTQQDCETSNYCGGGQTYDCTDWTSPSGCQSVQGGGGQFSSMDDCLTSPCQCDDIILAWPLYLNNPNNPNGNWYGTPNHDGPSNSNAIQNQLNNLQNNPNYPGGNPAQQHKTKCREAALQFWLSSGIGNTACCSDPGFAVGAATADVLGCVTQQWINTMDNFMNQHAGWPGQGCNWLNTALANVTAQQQNFSLGSNGYCKTQGKIDFINNFKQTGNSTYLTGQAVFPLPCI